MSSQNFSPANWHEDQWEEQDMYNNENYPEGYPNDFFQQGHHPMHNNHQGHHQMNHSMHNQGHPQMNHNMHNQGNRPMHNHNNHPMNNRPMHNHNNHPMNNRPMHNHNNQGHPQMNHHMHNQYDQPDIESNGNVYQNVHSIPINRRRDQSMNPHDLRNRGYSNNPNHPGIINNNGQRCYMVCDPPYPRRDPRALPDPKQISRSLIGRPVVSARQIYPFIRVVQQDNRPLAVTHDYRPNRINVETRNGVISKIAGFY